ncbi:Methenyltetrahydrofolate synthase domain-containing protein [Tupaia chinensis]|uniref:Methenyltetrahydrofolate synthase domain-containing protein n=1 Tax=Tupaia chinensis TaxID=246437 RepID=L9KJI5_TUPCH|nr:Methenyltetrahydrofolate synthase domain-containing protein [Tupaia chinensis]
MDVGFWPADLRESGDTRKLHGVQPPLGTRALDSGPSGRPQTAPVNSGLITEGFCPVRLPLRAAVRHVTQTRGVHRAGVSKQDIREQMWDYMESQNLADFPRPVHHRIPNFKGASRAAEHFPGLQVFKAARTVKVNPDAPQRNVRFLVLSGSHLACQSIKGLDVFARAWGVKVDPDKPLEGVRLLALQGVRSYSVPIGLDSKVCVDLVVVGSVAVSEKGWRIGKGEGYADLEYAMMVSMGAVSQQTPVVTVVHDCQVVDIPEALLGDHDVTVDYILTPTRVIATGCERPRPVGIMWSKDPATAQQAVCQLQGLSLGPNTLTVALARGHTDQ